MQHAESQLAILQLARGTTASAAAIACLALSCSAARPAEPSVHQTFETAEVGLYTGGWPEAGSAASAHDVATADGGSPAQPDAALGPPLAADGTCGPPGRVCGVAESTSGYCGGPAMSQEMLDRFATPTPTPDLGLVVRAGDTNSADTPIQAQTRTDRAGRFVLELPRGTWCIVEEAKVLPPDDEGHVDPDCLANWFRTCDFVIVVGDQPLPAAMLQFNRPCGGGNPCMPPLALP